MRRLGEDDEALYCDLYTDTDTMRFIRTPLSPERAARSFRKILQASERPDGPMYFVMLDQATQHAIGLCAIQQPDMDNHCAEVGMMLKAPARALGYATEAFAALVATAFSTLPIDTVWVQYHPANMAAERLFIGLGFLPGTDVAIGDVDHAQCIRSLHRSAVSAFNTSNQRGEDNVERHQLS